MESSKDKRASRRIGNPFTSLKLTIFLLIILAVTSILGTIIPQNVSQAQYLEIYELSTYKVLSALGCLDLYHCWWYSALLFLLSLNLIVCSCKRFPGTLRVLQKKSFELDEGRLKSLSFKESFTRKKKPEKLREIYCRTLTREFKKPVITRKEGECHFFAEKGKKSLLGVYVVHSSIIIIFVGAIIGNYFGFNGFLELVEGESRSQFFLEHRMKKKDLGFSIRCDDFELTHYENSRQPKDYKSILTIIDEEKEVFTKTIEVNHPLRYKGINFYQASYGTTVRGGEIIFKVTSKQENKEGKEYQARIGSSFKIEGGETEVKIERFVPDFAMGEKGMVVAKSNELRNPAVELLVLKNGIPQYKTWVFQKFPRVHVKKDADYFFDFIDFKGKIYTGLQVAKDPGVKVVWAGCILLVFGIMVTFFLSHQRVWLRLTADKGKTVVTLAGACNRNKEGFEQKFAELTKILKESEN